MHFKNVLKRVLKKPLTLKVIAWLIAKLLGLSYRLNRWSFVGEDIPKSYIDQNKPFLVCFWHGRLAMTCFAWRFSPPFHMLISGHQDGQLIAHTVGHHGIFAIAGSKSKGGTQALRSILKTLKKGEVVGITPDGPRGPRFKVQPGILAISRLAKVDILPVTFSSTRRVVWSSWDRLVLSLPFGRGIIQWGQPLSYKDLEKQTEEEALERIEAHMNALMDEADNACGHTSLKMSK